MFKIQKFKIESNLVPSPIKCEALLPEDYEISKKTYPLLLTLHGGGGHQGFLKNIVGPVIQDLWENKLTPEMILITPHCKRCLYMNYRDGSQMWETFIINELLPYIRKKYPVIDDPNQTFIGGVSMGGLGALRMGFKYCDKFGAILAFEPGIEPALEWKNIKIEDKFYRTQDFMEKIFGSPIDEDYWKVNNPAFIIKENAIKIRESGIKIYLEIGTDDMLGLYRGAEFLHRIMFDKNIKHEFRYVYGADHVGDSFKERIFNGFSFLNRILQPPKTDPQIVAVRKIFKQMMKEAGIEEK
ncbi:MAG: alpha/beta hydrolase [Promethearchaeota archaeon]